MKFDINAPVLIVLVALLFLSTPVDSGEVSATLEAVTKEVGSEVIRKKRWFRRDLLNRPGQPM